MKTGRLLLTLLVLGTYIQAQAAGLELFYPSLPDSTQNQPEEPSPAQLKTLKKSVAQSRNLLGQTASAIGIGLDSLFGSPDKSQANESTILLKSGVKLDESGTIGQISSISFQADLPATSSKLQLLVRIEEEHELADNGELGSTANNSSENAATEKKTSFESRVLQTDHTGIFIRYILQPINTDWQTTFDTGFQFANNSQTSLEPVSYFRIGQTFYAGGWLIRPVPSIFWTESLGLGIGTALHTLKPINATSTLQHTSSINYILDDANTRYHHGWQLVNVLSQDTRATYGITFYTTDNADSLVDEAKVSATLRRRIDGEWLFFSVTPENTLSAHSHYKNNFSLTFQLEAKFGTQY